MALRLLEFIGLSVCRLWNGLQILTDVAICTDRYLIRRPFRPRRSDVRGLDLSL